MNTTPGPWKVLISRSNRPVFMVVTEDKTGPVICDMANHNQNKEIDARLIAAAPKLLEACKVALEAAANLPSGNERFDRQILDDVYNRLSVVIAEAEGEEPA